VVDRWDRHAAGLLAARHRTARGGGRVDPGPHCAWLSPRGRAGGPPTSAGPTLATLTSPARDGPVQWRSCAITSARAHQDSALASAWQLPSLLVPASVTRSERTRLRIRAGITSVEGACGEVGAGTRVGREIGVDERGREVAVAHPFHDRT